LAGMARMDQMGYLGPLDITYGVGIWEGLDPYIHNVLMEYTCNYT
jgi:hypothetical protein